MASTDLVEHRHRPDARSGFQHRHDLGAPDLDEWIRSPAAAWSLPLRRRPRVGFDAVGGGGGKPGLRGGDGGRVGVARTHVQPHLTIVDVQAGQALILHWLEESDAWSGRPRPPDALEKGATLGS